MIRGMIPFPDEAQAREAVRRELEWVRSNVIQAEHDGGEGGGSGTVRVVEDCQQFVMTAPPPGGDGASGRQQRTYCHYVFSWRFFRGCESQC